VRRSRLLPGSQHRLDPSVSVGETSRPETATRLETTSPPETATRRPGIVARVGSTLSARRLDRRDRLAFLGLAGMLALGVVLHLWGLGRTGMRGDEAVYAGQAAVLAGAEGYDRHFILASRGTRTSSSTRSCSPWSIGWSASVTSPPG
jgi:hypothetical protein